MNFKMNLSHIAKFTCHFTFIKKDRSRANDDMFELVKLHELKFSQ
jgi:hypothetical protein